MSTETPRTDEAAQCAEVVHQDSHTEEWVDAEFARQLERELSRVTEERDAALHHAEKLATTLELERNSAESAHRVLRGALDIGPEGNVLTAIRHLKAERAARIKMHDEMERQSCLATEARMDRDAALRRVRELESLATGNECTADGGTWVEVFISNDRLSPEKVAATLGLAFPDRLDAAEKGEKE